MLGRYQILGGLANGGMAEILLGRMTGMAGFSRPVVVKRIHPEYAADSSFVTMLVDEARIAAGLQHANVVQVLELGEQDGEVFLAMEYLEGESLHQLANKLRSGKELLLPRLAAHIVAEACAGLSAVHDLAVVHRDISPENLFVTYQGVVKVLDFGVAKASDRLTKTQTGHIKGKYAYMAPEQFDSHVDPRSDLFALGIVLHELCTGESLFRHLNPLLISHAIREQPIPSLSEIKRDVPERLAAICERALERDLERRWQSAAAMGDALRGFIDHTVGDPRQELRQLMARVFRVEAAAKRDRAAELAVRWSATEDYDDDPITANLEVSVPTAQPSRRRTPLPRMLTPTNPAVALVTSPALESWSATQESTIVAEPAVPRRRRKLGFVMAVGIALVTLVVALARWSSDDPQPARPPSPAGKPARTPPSAVETARTPSLAVETARTPSLAVETARTPPVETARPPPAAVEIARTPPLETAIERPTVKPPPKPSPIPLTARATVTAKEAAPAVVPIAPREPSAATRPRPIERVAITISSKPPGAEIVLGGERVGTTPAKVSLRKAQKPLILMLRRDGFIEKSVAITPDRAKTVTLELQFRKFGAGPRPP